MNRLITWITTAAIGLAASPVVLGQSQGAYPSFAGQKKIAVIMLSWSDRAAPATRQQVADRVWNDPKSARNYYLDLSRGAFEFVLPAGSSGGVAPASTPDIYGPYELSIAAGYSEDITFANADDRFGSQYVFGSQSVARTLAAADGYDPANYDYIMYVTPKAEDTGGLRGYAGFASNYQHNFEVSNRTINHEIGHNLGMHHSNLGLNNGYGSYDCIMANNRVPHIDGPHTYQMGWYPDDVWSLESYGQFDIENLAQPNSDNLKLIRFDRAVHGATNNASMNFWVEYRIRGVGQDNDLDNRWDRTVTIHQTSPSSRRPGDSFNYPLTNEMANLDPQGSYTGVDNTCTIRFVRENSNSTATVQLIDPDGNQPPEVTSDQHYHAGTGTNLFEVLATDAENDALTYTIVTPPASGTLTHSGSTFTYTVGIPGTYSFVVRVNDGQYDSYDENCNITVHPSSTPAIIYSATTFPEHYTSDGTIPDAIELNLIFDTFTGTDGRDLVTDGDVTVTNLPTGLTAQIIKISDQRARMSLSGSASTHDDADDVNNLTISFSNSSFNSGSAGSITDSTRNDLMIDFTDATGWNVALAEDFEDPVVSGFSRKTLPASGNWVRSNSGFGSDNLGIINKDGGDFSDSSPSNHQAFAFRYTNSGLTTAEGVIGSIVANAGYRVSFKVVMDGGLNNGTPYACQLIAFGPGADRGNTNQIPSGSTLLHAVSGDSSVDGSFTTVNFEFSIDPTTHAAEVGKDIGLRFIGGSTSAIIDDVVVTSTSAPASTGFAGWSNGAAFGDDANGDGVGNGIAWLLGASDPNTEAHHLLPTAQASAGSLVMNFTCLRQSLREGAMLRIQCSSDLGTTDAWTNIQAEVPDASAVINGISFVISANADPSLIDVQASMPAGAGTKLFGRLEATPSP